MKRIMLKVLILAGVMAFASPVFATEEPVPARAVNERANACVPQETATVSLNITGTETDIKNVKMLVDKKMEEVKAVAAEAKLGEITLQNYNYNTYNNGGGGCGVSGAGSLQYNASFSFNVKPIDQAADLASLLTAKGYNVSLNVNSYNNCSESGYAD